MIKMLNCPSAVWSPAYMAGTKSARQLDWEPIYVKDPTYYIHATYLCTNTSMCYCYKPRSSSGVWFRSWCCGLWAVVWSPGVEKCDGRVEGRECVERGGAPEFQLTPREPNWPVAVDPRDDSTVWQGKHTLRLRSLVYLEPNGMYTCINSIVSKTAI